MRKYAVAGLTVSTTSTPATAFNLIGATTIRPLVAEITFGVRSTPNSTDQQIEFQVGNTTAAGTAGSSPNGKPLDPQDVAAQVTTGITHPTGTSPTYGATFFLDTDMNQRGLYRWVAEIGFELAGAPTASNGVAGRLFNVAAAAQMSMVPHWKE